VKFDDDQLAAWCRRHDGVIAVDDRKQIGLTERSFFNYVDAGVLVRAHPGVYRHAAHPVTFASRLRAALVAGGETAFASGPSLMRLYDIRGEWPERPEITLLGTEHLALDGVKIRRIDRLDPADIRPRLGFPALAPPLGLLLLGASVPRHRVVVAVHDMVFLGFTKRSLLVDAAKRYGGPGRRGTVSFGKAVLSLGGDGKATQSNFELAVLTALRERGLVEPSLQFPVVDAGGKRRKLDLAWPSRLLDVETDGDRWHLDAIARREMARRDQDLGRLGWTTVRIGQSEWELDPAGCLDRVVEVLD
jgi:very-short-patch-repair endonuclease